MSVCVCLGVGACDACCCTNTLGGDRCIRIPLHKELCETPDGVRFTLATPESIGAVIDRCEKCGGADAFETDIVTSNARYLRLCSNCFEAEPLPPLVTSRSRFGGRNH